MDNTPMCCYCRWFSSKQENNPTLPKDLFYGVCRYNPPAPKGFPIVSEDDYCRMFCHKDYAVESGVKITIEGLE